MKFQTRFSHARTGLVTTKPSRVRSEFRDDCDLRNIIQRHSIMPPVSPVYLDETKFPHGGLHGFLEFSREIAQVFDGFPLKAREYFNYDPNKLVEFVLDNKNRDKAVELGLLPPTPPLSVGSADN